MNDLIETPAHVLCAEIEKLPAGDQQTKVSIIASELLKLIKAKNDAKTAVK